MEDKINIAELLKDCPKGMELDCTMFNNVVLYGVNGSSYPISILAGGCKKSRLNLTKTGCCNNNPDAKCVIFPKGKTTWEGFVPPCQFKDGDIITCNNSACTFVSIFKDKPTEKSFQKYCSVILDDNKFFVGIKYADYANPRFATEEEKAKLFKSIRDNGYKWNPEIKTLEKLPKFKVGDRIKLNTCSSIYTITDLLKDKYRATIHSYDLYEIEFERQDAYELVPNKFDINTLVPFESKVLVRHNRDNKWCGSFFSHIDEDFHSHCYKFVTTSGRSYPMCIPYEGNEHLLGKTDDCDEYFEIWK